MSFATVRERLQNAAKREVKHYSKQTLATLLGVSLPTYYKLEISPELLSVEQAEKLAEHLGCSVERVYSREEL